MNQETLAKKLKDILEALEKCRQSRVQLKQKLTKEGLSEDKELELARDVYDLSNLICFLEEDRRSLIEEELRGRGGTHLTRTSSGAPNDVAPAATHPTGQDPIQPSEAARQQSGAVPTGASSPSSTTSPAPDPATAEAPAASQGAVPPEDNLGRNPRSERDKKQGE